MVPSPGILAPSLPRFTFGMRNPSPLFALVVVHREREPKRRRSCVGASPLTCVAPVLHLEAGTIGSTKTKLTGGHPHVWRYRIRRPQGRALVCRRARARRHRPDERCRSRAIIGRSEERRVGKEGRTRWFAYD